MGRRKPEILPWRRWLQDWLYPRYRDDPSRDDWNPTDKSYEAIWELLPPMNSYDNRRLASLCSIQILVSLEPALRLDWPQMRPMELDLYDAPEALHWIATFHNSPDAMVDRYAEPQVAKANSQVVEAMSKVVPATEAIPDAIFVTTEKYLWCLFHIQSFYDAADHWEEDGQLDKLDEQTLHLFRDRERHLVEQEIAMLRNEATPLEEEKANRACATIDFRTIQWRGTTWHLSGKRMPKAFGILLARHEHGTTEPMSIRRLAHELQAQSRLTVKRLLETCKPYPIPDLIRQPQPGKLKLHPDFPTTVSTLQSPLL